MAKSATGSVTAIDNRPAAMNGDEIVTVRPQGRFIADNALSLVVAALDGLGVAYLPEPLVADHICSGALVPIMQAQKSGAIVNISTAWVSEPSAMFPTSAVFRAGLAAYTKIYADTYAGDGIRINNVLPGWIDSLPATEERRDSVPMKRYGTSGEVAATISFLVSEGAGYITGQSLRIDGGLTRSV